MYDFKLTTWLALWWNKFFSQYYVSNNISTEQSSRYLADFVLENVG